MSNSSNDKVVRFPRQRKPTPTEEQAATSALRANIRHRQSVVVALESPHGAVAGMWFGSMQLYVTSRHPEFDATAKELRERLLAGERVTLDVHDFRQLEFQVASEYFEPPGKQKPPPVRGRRRS